MTPDPRTVIAFTERACQLGTIDALNAAAGAVLAPFGVSSFSANLISAPGRIVRPGILFGHRWLDWSRLYTRKGYAEFDPALAMLRQMSTPFTWSEAQARFGSPKGAKVIRDCLEHTGSSEGIVVPVRGIDGAVFTAAFSGADLATSGEVRGMLQLIGHYYVSRGCELAYDIALNPVCPLTGRQIDCLRWVHEGKTDGEIGVILGISPHTAHTHIENAMRALGVSKRAIAARHAYKSGWFDYSDQVISSAF